MRKPIIAGNWKMHKTVKEAVETAVQLRGLVSMVRDVEIVIAPPFTALHSVGQKLDDSNIKLAAQDVFWEEKGAFTGEVSPPMLADIGCSYCIVGHSERRQYFGETDDKVRKKAKALLSAGIIPIVCVGETLTEREEGKTSARVTSQVKGSLAGFEPEEIKSFIVAYEPRWAIGTGRNASPEQAEEVHLLIRDTLTELSNKTAAESVRIQYGGSVKPEIIAGFMAKENIDGALVGGASLNASSFAKIVKYKK